MTDVPLPIAFGFGFLSFFSPCILPLIPAYILYITGTTMEDELKDKRLFALIRTLGFVIGFTIIFMIMGISASYIGKLFIRNKEIFSKVSGVLIIVFGLNLMGIIKLRFINTEKRVRAPRKITNWFSSILMGMAFAAGWTPCFGAVLGSILIYAGSAGTALKGFYLLLAYSIGMAIPFILTAVFINLFSRFLVKTEKIMPYISKVGGVILVIFGLLIFFNKLIIISGWMV